WGPAARWGLVGGLCALLSPILGFTWGGLTAAVGARKKQWAQLFLAFAVAVLTTAPWMARNYMALGRWIPIKSNLGFELSQSQCRTKSGVVSYETFAKRPYVDKNERAYYSLRGELAYVDEKRALFIKAVRDNPWDFVRRVGNRFLAATLAFSLS